MKNIILVCLILIFNSNPTNSLPINGGPTEPLPDFSYKVCLFHGEVYEMVSHLIDCSESEGHDDPVADGHDPDTEIDADDPECFSFYVVQL